ncbi:HesA/MoeB/ThiF family protein [Sulfobacillus harzensis]|uniref:Thiamine biosynthesis protein ThiF n=1 Tax=Sulfobacillus harzensis TaxID=2729629 RepID=A0A7Y0L305_9FIRM|nr:ThiF family adenylyltransferase [Sulfobacillus harzensis]NMP22364.1 thiamine biosynthesis protein ThiF [Sulfobacillus harzensis]
MKAAIVGAGGIGSPLAQALKETEGFDGVWIIDGDHVQRSNLPRQPWYTADTLGDNKAEALAAVLGAPFHAVHSFVDAQFNWPDLDIIFDASDNWPARLAIQDAARRMHIPWIFSSAVRWEGQSAFMSPDGPCLACLFGETLTEGLRCFEAGVVGFVTLATAGQALDLFLRWRENPEDPELRRLHLLEGRQGLKWSVGFPPGRCQHGMVQ